MFHRPRVSPSGEYVAAVGGGRYGDACYASTFLVVLKLGEALTREATHDQEASTGLEWDWEAQNTTINPRDMHWQDADHLVVEFRDACPSPFEEGLYC